MQRYVGAVGAMSIRRRWLEEGSLKLRCIATWLCCALLVGWSLVPTASAQTVTYIHTDALGSVVAESDANGNVIKRYDYEPYGAVVGGPVADGPGYTGHVGDAATGLSQMQQRYMDPQLAVFLSVDPVTAYEQPVGQFNRYRYANGNPYRFTDPDGRQAAERFVEQHRKDMEAGNGDVYKPLQPVAIAVTGVMLAPVVVEVGMAALANPVAVATATEIGAGAAGVTGTGAVAGRITGYTKHGLNQAISRDGGRGVSPKAILSAVREPLKVAEQAGGKTVYTGRDAKVVLNGDGKVITTIPRNSNGVRDPRVK